MLFKSSKNEIPSVNNNGSAGKKMLGDSTWTCTKWVNTVFKIMFKSMIAEVIQA